MRVNKSLTFRYIDKRTKFDGADLMMLLQGVLAVLKDQLKLTSVIKPARRECDLVRICTSVTSREHQAKYRKKSSN